MPHEMKRYPITYYNTLVMDLIETNERMLREQEEPVSADGLADVDVDAMIRSGRTTGLTDG